MFDGLEPATALARHLLNVALEPLTQTSQWRCAIALEQRRDQRIPLSIPLLLRGLDKNGKAYLDLTLALNVSAGGALVATREHLRPASRVTLEVPSVPLPFAFYSLQNKSDLRARVLRSTNKNGYYLCAVRFAHPLV